MMSFKQFISEDDHKNGTYVSVEPTVADADRLYAFVAPLGINNLLDKSEYHATVIYSKAPCPGVKHYNYNLPVTGIISGWKIFEAGIGRCLVATIESAGLQRINEDLKRDYGATSSFPTYIPHLTVSYDHIGDAPTKFPSLTVTFDTLKIKGINPEWKPN